MKLETSEMQGLIISGYRHLPWSAYLFLHIKDVQCARQWLADIAPRIASGSLSRDAKGKALKASSVINVAFTFSGLATLELAPEALQIFSEEFRQGMADATRARRMGDNGSSAPERWEIGAPGDEPNRQIHILLIIKTPTQAELSRIREDERALLQKVGGLTEANPAEEGHVLVGEKEHFGFRDSISQPEIAGTPKPSSPGRDSIKAGEFVLGYENEYGIRPATPVVPVHADRHGTLPLLQTKLEEQSTAGLKDFGRNGTYLVFRKLHQHVAALRSYIAASVEERDRALVAAKFVGRWPSGLPLILSPLCDDPALADQISKNDFLYAQQDPFGYRCPLGSHIRRSNPRDSMENRTPAQSLENVRRHRIIRRGASYGEPLPEGVLQEDDRPRGLLFICINTDIKRQFEFIQQTWINNPKFHGLYSDRDPVTGDNEEPGEAVDGQPRNFTIQCDGLRTRLTHLPRFVTVKGGGYFFLPGIPSIYYLARIPRTATLERER